MGAERWRHRCTFRIFLTAWFPMEVSNTKYFSNENCENLDLSAHFKWLIFLNAEIFRTHYVEILCKNHSIKYSKLTENCEKLSVSINKSLHIHRSAPKRKMLRMSYIFKYACIFVSTVSAQHFVHIFRMMPCWRPQGNIETTLNFNRLHMYKQMRLTKYFKILSFIFDLN